MNIVKCKCSHVHLFPSVGRLSELFPGCIQVTIWWFPLSCCHGDGEAMMNAHDPNLLATNRCTRIQSFRSKALTWKHHPSAIPACSPSAAVLGALLFSSITHSVSTIRSCLHLHFAKANEVCSKPVFQCSEHLCSPLSQF